MLSNIYLIFIDSTNLILYSTFVNKTKCCRDFKMLLKVLMIALQGCHFAWRQLI